MTSADMDGRWAAHHDQPVSVWGLPRSVGPAGLIMASAADVLTFADTTRCMYLGGRITPKVG